MRILIACEYSGRVRNAFLKLGHDVLSCDLLPSEDNSPYHYQGDIRDLLTQQWDMVIAFPDCTYICGSGWHWIKRGRTEADGRPRIEHANEAIKFARMFIDGDETAHIPLRAVENPVGKLSTIVRKPDQIIQPHQFGDDASKATCLWLHGLPLLKPTLRIAPRIICCGLEIPNGDKYGCPNCNGEKVAKPRWGNQCDSGQNKLGPSDDRWKERSRTYQGIADAMAEQWGNI